MAVRILSSSFTPIYQTNPNTGNLCVEVSTENIISEPSTLNANSSTSFTNVEGTKDIIFQIKVESLVTPVVIIFEGTLNNVDWFNIGAKEQIYTINENGTYGFTFYGVLKSVRVRVISDLTNTNTVVTVQIAKS